MVCGLLDAYRVHEANRSDELSPAKLAKTAPSLVKVVVDDCYVTVGAKLNNARRHMIYGTDPT